MYISGMWGAKTPGQIEPKFLEEDIRDLMTCLKFGVDRLRGLAKCRLRVKFCHSNFDGRPYNTLTLPCDGVSE